MLVKDDAHYWYPIPIITDWLTDHVIAPRQLVVDVGCGHNPFRRADIGLDRVDRTELEKAWKAMDIEPPPESFRLVRHDFARTALPFDDKEVDFIYCRHTLEDMHDPFLLMAEMQRVAKAGYIETPSPVCEIARGVDGGPNAYWRGYHHHRFIVWENEGSLNFITKFPMIEHIQFDEDRIESALRGSPLLWNTYYLWKDEIRWKHWEMPLDFEFWTDYPKLLVRSATETLKSAQAFSRMVDKQRQAA